MFQHQGLLSRCVGDVCVCVMHLSHTLTHSHTHTNTNTQGYVSIAEGDTQGIKRAVYTQGPLAISIDAGQPSFRFYASGVYYEPNCLWKEYDLDHAVTLVGYGEEDGEAYWEVRNSWSKYWGDAGYIKMSQRGHACGVATNAAYTVVGAAEDVVEGTGAEE